ncbi:MAG: CoA-acylating methylmalonate-semialdehyde dehydrogenase [Planctomycetota bacterium]|jgi:malonate-semialdehyde dehydrogenase (acetylating)/methylmalonate-semialdehyde dehydrogenase
MSAAYLTDDHTCKILVGGRWTRSRATEFGEVTNSSTGQTIARVPFSPPEEVEQVVLAAHDASKSWGDVPPVERARVMFRYLELLTREAEEIAALISREHGKTLEESRGSIRRGMEMVEFAAGAPALLMGECLENIAGGVDCDTHRHPLGVCVGITPFNFPAMVPMWMYPLAIVCGNAFVLKPSEKVPLSAMAVTDLLCQAGLPPGVISVVHGAKESVQALLTHPLVQAISFVGSTPVAEFIYQTATGGGKRVQAAGGAKNHVFIMPDADLDDSIAALKHSAFGCAGERCMAGSLALPVGGVGDDVVERLTSSARGIVVGRTDRPGDVEMGPLVTGEHLERVQRYVQVGLDEGAELALDGRAVSVAEASQGYYLGPTVFDRVRPEMTIAREEVFGPVLPVVRIDSLEEGLELLQECPYGNGAVIFTRDGRAAREFKRRANAGMIGINVGVPAPMAWFPFTGWNRSFFGDLHIQGREGIQFYTRQKMTMTRWLKPRAGKIDAWGI